MLTLDMLSTVSTIVVHENSPGNACPDGTASAIILRDALPGRRVVFTNHDTLARMKPELGVLFCDIAPVADIDEWIAMDAIVIDHHEKQRDTVKRFGPRGIFETGLGVSGASLAYEHVWYPSAGGAHAMERELVYEFAKLAAIRDSWDTGNPQWRAACEQAEALRFYPWERFPSKEPFADEAARLALMMQIGEVLYEKRQEQAKNDAARAYRTTTKKGTRVAIIGTVETSDAADKIDSDVLVGFRYFAENHPEKGSIPKLVLSFRARGGYDVGALAKSLGGGGHRAAAGCTLTVHGEASLLHSDPYFAIGVILDNFERSQG